MSCYFCASLVLIFPPSHPIFWFLSSPPPSPISCGRSFTSIWAEFQYPSSPRSVSILFLNFSTLFSIPSFSLYILYTGRRLWGIEINRSPSPFRLINLLPHSIAPQPTMKVWVKHQKCAVSLILICPEFSHVPQKRCRESLCGSFLVWTVQMFLEPNSTFQLLWKKNLQLPSHIFFCPNGQITFCKIRRTTFKR